MTESANAPSPDRYVTFVGMDCDGKARQIVAGLRQAMTMDGRDDPFWRYFAAKLDGTRGPAHDELYHIHCHLNDLRDLVERWDETELGELLENLETECC
jgi:hypothetical protein